MSKHLCKECDGTGQDRLYGINEEELHNQHNEGTECVCVDCEDFRANEPKPIQSRLFSPDSVIENTWNGKYPCPICEKGKLNFSRTNTHIYINCPKCHTTLIREYSKGEFEGKFDNE